MGFCFEASYWDSGLQGIGFGFHSRRLSKIRAPNKRRAKKISEAAIGIGGNDRSLRRLCQPGTIAVFGCPGEQQRENYAYFVVFVEFLVVIVILFLWLLPFPFYSDYCLASRKRQRNTMRFLVFRATRARCRVRSPHIWTLNSCYLAANSAMLIVIIQRSKRSFQHTERERRKVARKRFKRSPPIKKCRTQEETARIAQKRLQKRLRRSCTKSI